MALVLEAIALRRLKSLCWNAAELAARIPSEGSAGCIFPPRQSLQCHESLAIIHGETTLRTVR
jgi:hypothetical protein